MTFKSIIPKLRLQRHLVPLELPLEPDEVVRRQIFGTSKFMEWWLEALPKLPMDLDVEMTPKAQISALIQDYISGMSLDFPVDLSELEPNEKGVWEFRTVDVRVFGFFTAPNIFIATYGDSAKKCHDHSLHAGYRNETVRIRGELELECIFGGIHVVTT